MRPSRIDVLLLLFVAVCTLAKQTAKSTSILCGACLSVLNVPLQQNHNNAKDRRTAKIDVFRSKGGGLYLRSRALNQTLQVRHDEQQQPSLKVEVVDDYLRTKGDTPFDDSYERIFGIYKLPAGYCVALVKSSESASSFIDESYGVRKVSEISFIEVPSTETSNADDQLVEKQRIAIALMQDTFARHSLYFSTNDRFDVTRTLQSNSYRHQGTTTVNNAPMWQSCDERFFWNLNVVSDLIAVSDLHGCWITPFMNAWVASETMAIAGQSFTVTILSRRSRRRQGPRYIKRGSDGLGDVANFVETEQVLQRLSDKRTFSFVQIRGSIPIFWTQPETWKLKPSIKPQSDLATHGRALKTHLVDMARFYVHGTYIPLDDAKLSTIESRPGITLINLIDKSGTQGQLGKWLVAAFQVVERGVANAFPAAGLSVETAGAAVEASPTAPSTITTMMPLTALAGAALESDLPYRIERDQSLTNRKAVTQMDFKCPLTDADCQRIGSNGQGWSYNRHAPTSSLSQLRQRMDDIGTGLETRTAPSSGQKLSLPVRFVWFDYHKKCKGGKVEALQEMYPSVASSLSDDGYCELQMRVDKESEGLEAVHNQHKVIRTNCVDCLDRTNVVQTLVARWSLLGQLKAIGLYRGEANAMSLPDGPAERTFRAMWGDNGDHMSMLYAGTKALKRDVTRLGRRTNQGAIDDGVNSAMRYFINNYQDPVRQVGIDRILGLVEGDNVRRAVQGLPDRRVESGDNGEGGEGENGEGGEEDGAEEDEENDSEDDEDIEANSTSQNLGITEAPAVAVAVAGDQKGPQAAGDEFKVDESYKSRIDDIFAQLKLEQYAALTSARERPTREYKEIQTRKPPHKKNRPQEEEERRRTVATLDERKSPIKLALEVLRESRFLLLTILVFVAFRIHSMVLSGGLK